MFGMPTVDLLMQYWPLILGAVTVGAWLFRLEGRVGIVSKVIDEIKENRKEDLEAAREAREATNSRLDRLDTKLDTIFGEIRGDLKLLFTKGNSE